MGFFYKTLHVSTVLGGFFFSLFQKYYEKVYLELYRVFRNVFKYSSKMCPGIAPKMFPCLPKNRIPPPPPEIFQGFFWYPTKHIFNVFLLYGNSFSDVFWKFLNKFSTTFIFLIPKDSSKEFTGFFLVLFWKMLPGITTEFT